MIAVTILSAAAIFVLLFFLLRQQRKNQAVTGQLQHLKNQIEDLQLLLDYVADRGKITYISGVADNDPENNPVYKFAENRSEAMTREQREEYLQVYRDFFSGKRKDFSIKYSLSADGQIKELCDYGKQTVLPGSAERKFILTTMDISELAKQNLELANADIILNAIFDNLPGHILIKSMSSDFSYIRCNNTFSSLLQMHPDDIVGKTDFDLFDSDLAQRIRINDMQIVANRTTADSNWYFSTPDGKEHAIRFISRLLKRPDGSEIILKFGIDVSRQERIAGKLRKRNKELRLLLAQTDARIMLLDSNLQLVCATPAMQEYFLKQQSVSDSHLCCCELCDCGITDSTVCPAAAAAASGKMQFCSNNRQTGCQLQIKPLLNEDGSTDYLTVTLIDSKETLSGETTDD